MEMISSSHRGRPMTSRYTNTTNLPSSGVPRATVPLVHSRTRIQACPSAGVWYSSHNSPPPLSFFACAESTCFFSSASSTDHHAPKSVSFAVALAVSGSTRSAWHTTFAWGSSGANSPSIRLLRPPATTSFLDAFVPNLSQEPEDSSYEALYSFVK
ncbi:hypothetical protein BGW80DRAFT_657925 [Lactifluus volemus]|nr:hypothetical protein BGW80DRAFT_657925 [Lactifluus volemus]